MICVPKFKCHGAFVNNLTTMVMVIVALKGGLDFTAIASKLDCFGA